MTNDLSQIILRDPIDWPGLTLRFLPSLVFWVVLLLTMLGAVRLARRRSRSPYPRLIAAISASCLLLDLFAYIRTVSGSLAMFGEYEAVSATTVKAKATFMATYLDLFAWILPVAALGFILSLVLNLIESSRFNGPGQADSGC